MNVSIREFHPDVDTGFIYSTWAKSVFYKDDTIQTPRDEWFTDFYRHMSKHLGLSHILIACLSNDPNMILGYLILDGKRREMVYVKKGYRGLGISKLMHKGTGVDYGQSNHDS